VRAGWRRLVANVAAARPGLALDGVLVEAMGPPGLEMVVGARRDPQWGPVILVGLGGVWIEALGDVVLLPAHATKAEVVARLAGLKAARLLGAFRGAPARDVDAVAAVAVRLGALMRGTPDLLEVDVNPLVVHAAGDGATALDALFVAAA
jgi:succinyl-CoA synthetase beta subunit